MESIALRNFVWVALSLVVTPTMAGNETHIEVRGLSPRRGQVLIGVCTEAQFLKTDCAFVDTAAVGASRSLSFAVPNLAPGRYAVQVIYDLNRNFRLDTNAIGIPLEPVGFSENAVGDRGPPAFDSAAIDLPAEAPIVITVR
jgi:uncharacterized protein (DUF2141 family)